MNYTISVLDNNTNQYVNQINTNGMLILYLENGKIRVNGEFELSELAPMLTKILLEKLVK